LSTKAWLVGGVVAAGLALGASARADGFRVEEVPSVTSVELSKLQPGTILFSDHGKDPLADPNTGLFRFEDWARERPVEKQQLSLYPGFVEPTVPVTAHGVTKQVKQKLHVYVVEARFLIPRPASAIDLKRYATVAFLERIDPAIKHKRIGPEDAAPFKVPELAANRLPDRRWCEPAGQTLCIQSRYDLEGKLPLGIRLANKLEEGTKKIAEFLEFQSELRVLPTAAVDQAALAKLTGLSTPVAGVLEQSIFDVNQVMQSGKFLAVIQPHPADPAKTVATAFLALDVKTSVFERKKQYENVPVLRNLVPAQVLAGKSSFNSGSSLSAGLPTFSRNRLKAIAEILQRE
jgi:hypothetical protein